MRNCSCANPNLLLWLESHRSTVLDPGIQDLHDNSEYLPVLLFDGNVFHLTNVKYQRKLTKPLKQTFYIPSGVVTGLEKCRKSTKMKI